MIPSLAGFATLAARWPYSTTIRNEVQKRDDFLLPIVRSRWADRQSLRRLLWENHFDCAAQLQGAGDLLRITAHHDTPLERDQMEFASLDALVEDVRRHGYYGGIRLIKATIKRFGDECRTRQIELENRNFTIEYRTNIPVRVGLAGSSAIVTATIRALMAFFNVDIPKPWLPSLILSVELDELGIAAGLQDRVIQVYEGVVFMDFDWRKMQRQKYGDYESLDAQNLPPLFVAYHDTLAEGTEVPHTDLRNRFDSGDRQVHDAMKQFARMAQNARDLIVADRGPVRFHT